MYRVTILPSAIRELAALPGAIRRRIDERIQALAQEPRPNGFKALRGKSKGPCRLRSGDYRVIYRVEDRAREVTIVQIVNRRDAYPGR